MVTQGGENFSVMAHVVENWHQSRASFRRSQSHERDRPIPESWLRLIAMGRSQGALVDAAASNKAKCDCDSGDLVATGAGRTVAIGRWL